MYDQRTQDHTERMTLRVSSVGSSLSSVTADMVDGRPSRHIGGFAEVFVDGGRTYRTTRAWFWDFLIQLLLGACMIAFGVCFLVYYIRWTELQEEASARVCPMFYDVRSSSMSRETRMVITSIVNKTAVRSCMYGRSQCPADTFGVYVAAAAWCRLSRQNTETYLQNSKGVNELQVQTTLNSYDICGKDWPHTDDYSRENSFYACLTPVQVYLLSTLHVNDASNATTCKLCETTYKVSNVIPELDRRCFKQHTSDGVLLCAI